MGQTLTHGVYLPSEGERNCYSGLASNWRLLDGAIGTVAAHTTAIAGKADISHTHGNITNDGKVGTTANLPLITGTGGAITAGAFGNQANTFCEGNDSRLSDARTPVAHTHTKSDVTDLLNSNFIPSANNSYDLGSSSYQWNNLYAKNYFYNGVAWGLNKSNTWSGTNSFTAANININSSNFSLGDTVSSNQLKRFQWYDASSNRYACISATYATDKSVWVDIPLRTKNTEGTSFVDKGIRFQVKPDNTSALLPVNNSATDLGTSTNKWKTLNGINPGALSLPNYNAQDASWIGDLTIKDGSNYNLKTFTLNGWITINIPNTSGNLVVVNNGCGQIVTNEANGITGNNCAVFMPVVANVQISILLVLQTGESVKTAIFAPCLGNV